MRCEAAWCWLLLVPLLVYLVWLARRSYAHLTPWARRLSVGLRALILIALLAALSRPFMSRETQRNHLILLIDISKSVSADNLNAALSKAEQLLRASAGVSPRPTISVIAFGRGAELLIATEDRWKDWDEGLHEKLCHQRSLPKLYAERTQLISTAAGNGTEALAELERRIAGVERFTANVAGDYTDVEQAVRLALNCGASDEPRTIYVFTDANFNRGDWSAIWHAAADQRARLHTVILDKPSPAEVAVTDLVLPQTVRVDQGFTAEVRVASTVETSAEIEFYRDGYRQQQRTVTLHVGENAFKVGGLFLRDKGFHAFEAVLRPHEDSQVANNVARTLMVVPGEARVLYVDGDLSQIHYLKSALELEGMQVEARSAAGIPDNLSELLSFDAFILGNVPAERLSQRQMQMVRTYVQEFGGGFVMLGGDESFGLGGYYNTPIEEILPVRMPIQKDMQRPSLALMLVIDKSGSMEGVKIQLAKRAAIATAEAINPRDLIGIVGFDGEARVVLELTPASDHAAIANQVGGLEAGGGTFLYPALEEAHRRLVDSNARRKHVIILSDGQTQGFGYDDLASMMAADGVTTSTIGIGEGADMRLLEAVASAGGGRAYFTNDFYSIPQIFTREALRASKNMLVERMVVPTVVADDPVLKDIDTDELPVLTGYVATTAKPTASIIMVSDSGDPLLAKWRCGLGHTVAFTSEPKPRWAEDWIEWENFAKFWSQTVRSVTGQDLARDVHVECAREVTDRGVRLTADVRNARGEFLSDVELTLGRVTSNRGVVNLPVRQRAAGWFEAEGGDVVFGEDLQYVWRVRRGAGEEQPVSYGFVQSFSPEYATLGPSQATAAQLRQEGVGEVMSVADARLELNTAGLRRWIPLAPALLIVALLLVPADILVRRVG